MWYYIIAHDATIFPFAMVIVLCWYATCIWGRETITDRVIMWYVSLALLWQDYQHVGREITAVVWDVRAFSLVVCMYRGRSFADENSSNCQRGYRWALKTMNRWTKRICGLRGKGSVR